MAAGSRSAFGTVAIANCARPRGEGGRLSTRPAWHLAGRRQSRRAVHGTLRRHPHTRGAGDGPKRARLDRRPALLLALDAARNPGALATADAGGGWAAARRAARRPPQFRRATFAHRSLAGYSRPGVGR